MSSKQYFILILVAIVLFFAWMCLVAQRTVDHDSEITVIVEDSKFEFHKTFKNEKSNGSEPLPIVEK